MVKIDPRELQRRAQTERGFRCDVCDVKCPEALMAIQDGAHVCPNCAYPMSKSERELLHASEIARVVARSAANAAPLKYPGRSSLMDGWVALERFESLPMQLGRGELVSFTLYGINLSGDDELRASGADLAIADYVAAADGLSATFTIESELSAAIGLSDVTFNGSRYVDAIRVV